MKAGNAKKPPKDFAATVGRDWIRALLFDLKKKGKAVCTGKGRTARWRFVGE